MPQPANLSPSRASVSDGDIYRAIDALVGPNTNVSATDIPGHFVKINKEQHGFAVSESQLRDLRNLVNADSCSTVVMSREELFQMLKHLLESSIDEAPLLADVATPTAPKYQRRRSTRIRSNSDSSSSEDDDEQTPSRLSSSPARRRSIPRRSFPDDSSTYMLPSTIATSPDGALPPRVKKLSDASNKFEQRSRDDPPPSYMPLGRRPLPQSRRSSAQFSASARSDDGHASSDYTYTYKAHGRSVSSASVATPSLTRSPGAASPTSPPLDGYGSDTEDDRWGPGTTSMESALEKIRDAEEVQRLKEVVAELRNRIKSLEHERELAQQTHEDMVADIETRAENERQEHDIRAKDQLSRTETKYRKEIEAKEQEITEINEELDALSAKLSDMQAALENEKGKYAELRDTVEERDKDVSELRLQLELFGDQKQQVEEELGRQNAHAADLQEKLNARRQLESKLAATRTEVDLYKSTMSDLEKQLSDLRGGALYGGGGIASAGPATLTRNGGNQLSDELQTDDPVKPPDKIYVQTFVTRTITSPDGKQATYKDVATETTPLDVLNDPDFEEQREILRREGSADIEPEGARTPVQARSPLEEEALRSPPAYSAAPGPLDADALIKHMHPHTTKGAVRRDEDLQKAYDLVSKATGKRCHVIEEELESDDIMRDEHDGYKAKPGMVGRVFSWASAIGVVHFGGLVILTVLATQAFGTPPQRDPYDSFAYNGYVSWFDHTAAMARAGRVPT